MTKLRCFSHTTSTLALACLWTSVAGAAPSTPSSGAPAATDRSSASLSASDNPKEGDASTSTDLTGDAPSAAVAAQTPEGVKEAGQRYDRGLRLYAEGDYALAVIEFDRAYQLIPNYRVLYNIGQVRIQLGQYAKALQALEQYLREGGAKLSAARQQSVERDLEMLRSRTAHLNLMVTLEGAEVMIDNTVMATTPLEEPLLLTAGEHRLEIRKQGYVTHSSTVTLAGRDTVDLTVKLNKVPEGPTKRERVIVERQIVTGGLTEREVWMWSAWGATALLGAGSGVTGILGLTAANELKDSRADADATRETLDKQEKKAKTFFLATDVLAATALATAGVALYFTLSDDPDDEKKGSREQVKLGLEIQPSAVMFTGAF